MPLPGSGSVLAFILNMLHGTSPSGRGSSRDSWPGGPAAADSDLYWHRIVETFKYAYAKRTGLGDPSRYNVSHDIREVSNDMKLFSKSEWLAFMSEFLARLKACDVTWMLLL